MALICSTLHKKWSFPKDAFSKCDQIRSFLRIWSDLLKKSLKENFTFWAVLRRSLFLVELAFSRTPSWDYRCKIKGTSKISKFFLVIAIIHLPSNTPKFKYSEVPLLTLGCYCSFGGCKPTIMNEYCNLTFAGFKVNWNGMNHQIQRLKNIWYRKMKKKKRSEKKKKCINKINFAFTDRHLGLFVNKHYSLPIIYYSFLLVFEHNSCLSREIGRKPMINNVYRGKWLI